MTQLQGSRPDDWQQLDSTVVFRHPLFSLHSQKVRSPQTAAVHDALVIDSADWVTILPMTEDEMLVMIQQYRHGIGRITLEVPGGLIEPGEEPLKAAERELQEETGFSCKKASKIAEIDANPAIQNNKSHVFLCQGCRLTGQQKLDPMESISIIKVPLEHISALVANGSISHAIVLAALQCLSTHSSANSSL